MADTLFVNATASIPGTVVVAPFLNDVNTATYDHLSTVVGTNAITATGPLSLAAYATGQNFYLVPTGANTGAATINISGLGVRSITKNGAVALVAGDLAVGAEAHLVYDGTRFQLINPQTVAVTGIVPIVNGGTGVTTINPVGNCRLVKSSANLVLQPFQGNKLSFPAGYASIPSTGVSLAPTALTPATNYYIYAVQIAGVVTSLEASTTGHSIDTITGIEIKTGDATRVLVGLARTVTGPAWQDTAAQRFVISWFNRRPINGLAFYTAARTTTSLTFVEPNIEIRNEFLSWGTDAVVASLSGGVQNNLNAAATTTAVGLDSTTVPVDGGTIAGNQGASNSISFPLSCTATFTPNEGSHFVTLLGRAIGGGTNSYQGGAIPGERASMQTIIYG